MQQVEQGKIDLDADVKSISRFQNTAARRQARHDAQPHLQHVAGFEEQAKGILSNRSEKISAIRSAAQQWVPQRVFAPGTTPAYSNYGLAGRIHRAARLR